MKGLKKLADEIVSELVDCGAADDEPVEQYKKWTLQRLEKAFRALEQRAEAAEAKLAELQKQKAVGTVSIAMDWNTHRNIATVNMRPDLVVAEMKNGDEIFTRPAPAVSLAELVPPEVDGSNLPFAANGWNACRAAILRNIEEAG